MGHESKCAHLHGHRYKLEMTVIAPKLDSLGRVVDFGCLKRIAGGWIDHYWDHNMLLHQNDPLIQQSLYFPENGTYRPDSQVLIGRAPWIMSESRNPTAENIAVEFVERVQPLLPIEIRICKVVVHETPNCRAIYVPEIPTIQISDQV